MKFGVETAGTPDITMKEIQERYEARQEEERKRAEAKEQRRIQEIEEMGSMSMAEYIAKRSGKPYYKPENLEKMDMSDYISARNRMKMEA